MALKAVQQISPVLTIEVTGDDAKELLKELAFFSEWPTACPVCGSAVHVTHREPKGYEYWGLQCAGAPAHETTFGVKKDGSGLFYKAREPWSEVVRGRAEEDYEEAPYYEPEPAPQRTRQAVDNAQRGGGYAGNSGARPAPSQAPQEPRELQLQAPAAEGPCPSCNAPAGKPHGWKCTRGAQAGNAQRSGL